MEFYLCLVKFTDFDSTYAVFYWVTLSFWLISLKSVLICLFQFIYLTLKWSFTWLNRSSVLWRCWLGDRKGIRHVKTICRSLQRFLSGRRIWDMA